jgi:hypothetical protein
VDVSIARTVLPAQGKEVAGETDKSNFKSLNKWLESFKNKKKVLLPGTSVGRQEN